MGDAAARARCCASTSASRPSRSSTRTGTTTLLLADAGGGRRAGHPAASPPTTRTGTSIRRTGCSRGLPEAWRQRVMHDNAAELFAARLAAAGGGREPRWHDVASVDQLQRDGVVIARAGGREIGVCSTSERPAEGDPQPLPAHGCAAVPGHDPRAASTGTPGSYELETVAGCSTVPGTAGSSTSTAVSALTTLACGSPSTLCGSRTAECWWRHERRRGAGRPGHRRRPRDRPAAALLLATRGARVMATSRAASHELAELGLDYVVADLGDPQRLRPAVAETERRLGPIEILVVQPRHRLGPRAGDLGAGHRGLARDDADQPRRSVPAVAAGGRRHGRARLRPGRRTPARRPVELAERDGSAYSASKHGLIGLMRSVAQDAGPFGVTLERGAAGLGAHRDGRAVGRREARRRGSPSTRCGRSARRCTCPAAS